jgi:hypothetical protein
VLAVDAVGWFGIALVGAVILVVFISLPIYERVQRRREAMQRRGANVVERMRDSTHRDQGGGPRGGADGWGGGGGAAPPG